MMRQFIVHRSYLLQGHGFAAQDRSWCAFIGETPACASRGRRQRRLVWIGNKKWNPFLSRVRPETENPVRAFDQSFAFKYQETSRKRPINLSPPLVR